MGLSPQLKVGLLVSVGTMESLMPLPAPMFLLCGLEMLKMFSLLPARMDLVFWPLDGCGHLHYFSIQSDPFPLALFPLPKASLCRHQHKAMTHERGGEAGLLFQLHP